jgi:hypothetical protein
MERTELMKMIFPKALKGGAAAFLDRFLLTSLAPHFFPLFLREQKASKKLQELSHFEAVKWQLVEGGEVSLVPKDFLQINSSFQWVELSDEIWGLWRTPGPGSGSAAVQELRLQSEQAFLLETLGLDRKFTFDQILQWMTAHFPKAEMSEAHWVKALKGLMDLKVVY